MSLCLYLNPKQFGKLNNSHLFSSTVFHIVFPSIKNFWKMKKENLDDTSILVEDKQDQNKRERSTTPPPPQRSIPLAFGARTNLKYSQNDDSEMSEYFGNNTTASSDRSATPTIRSATPFDRPMTPAMRRVLTESLPAEVPRSATPFLSQSGRIQCLATTAKGLQCKNAAVAGNTKCRVHNHL
jgi:hypothetical protein